MASRKTLGDLQHAILDVLWDRQEATVAQVHGDLFDSRKLALTTIATMLRKMETRGLVDHHTVGRQFVYRAAMARSDARRDMVSQVVERGFAGDTSAMVSHLLKEGDFDPQELSALSEMIARRVSEIGGAKDE